MTRGPSTNASDAGSGVLTVDLAEQMRLRDALPVELKELVSKAPVAVDLTVIWGIWQLHGARAKALIEQVFDNEFPGWRMD